MKDVNVVNEKKGIDIRSDFFDEEIEGYKKCGSTDKKFDCKKDCWLSYSAVLSYID